MPGHYGDKKKKKTFGQGLKASAKASGITRAASGTKDAATMAMKTIALLKKKKKK